MTSAAKTITAAASKLIAASRAIIIPQDGMNENIKAVLRRAILGSKNRKTHAVNSDLNPLRISSQSFLG